MTRKQDSDPHKIEPGMEVEATKGDLGEQDVSKPKVTDVVQDQQGNVEKVVVTKGVVFKKKLEVPVDRVQSVDQVPEDGTTPGKVTIAAGKGEIASLKATGEEELLPENQKGLLDNVERNLPTHEGLRELEAANITQRDTGIAEPPLVSHKKLEILLRVRGPGFLGGMAGNDSSAVTAYAVDGANVGYGHLWLMLLSTPLYQAVQYSCGKIGRVTQKGFSDLLREYYGHWVAVLASLVLIIANIALIAADLVAIGSGLELITGLFWAWFVIPVAAILWYLTVFRNFESIKKIFIVMSLAFVTYIITAFVSGANWGAVLFHTFVPQLSFNFDSISSAVALLGATISPYSMFWQVQGEKEEKREGSTQQQVRSAALDIASGVISGNLVSFFIIVCTAATLFTHHHGINTAADAARSLEPLVGPLAKYLFAIGLIGAGIVAIPILLASTSYAIAGTFGWPGGLSKKPWQNEGFYLILTASLAIGLVVALLRFDPVQLIFWANVLAGVLAPVLVIFIFMVGNNRKIMGDRSLGVITNIGLALIALILIVGAVLLFYDIATGQR